VTSNTNGSRGAINSIAILSDILAMTIWRRIDAIIAVKTPVSLGCIMRSDDRPWHEYQGNFARNYITEAGEPMMANRGYRYSSLLFRRGVAWATCSDVINAK
jgi:hypothetical protein